MCDVVPGSTIVCGAMTLNPFMHQQALKVANLNVRYATLQDVTTVDVLSNYQKRSKLSPPTMIP